MRETNAIKFVESENPEFQYIAGLTVYQEMFYDGMLRSVNRNATGVVLPASQQMDKLSKIRNPLLSHLACATNAFQINVDGQDLNDRWRFIKADRQEKPDGKSHGTIQLRHTLRPLSLKIHTLLDGTAFMMRWLEIGNEGRETMALSSVSPWSGLLSNPEIAGWGASSPFSLGHFGDVGWGREGKFVWEPLATEKTTRLNAYGPFGTCGYECPFFIIRNNRSHEFFSCYLGWSGPWAADLFCDTRLYGVLHFKIGPNAPAPLRLIAAGETITTPKVHLGHVQADFDGCIQEAHQHIRRSVKPATPALKHAPTEYNAGNNAGAGLMGMSEERLLTELKTAALLGSEIFIVDAGWYGTGASEKRKDAPYMRFMGDWVAGEWLPNDLHPVIKEVRRNNMLFGLWFEPENIGKMSRIYKEHPEWVVKVNGQEIQDVGERFTLDFANPKVIAWVEEQLENAINHYDLDIFRIDAGPMNLYTGERETEGYVESLMWRHYEAFYALLDRIRQRHPKLIIENCCGGGGRNDLGLLSRCKWTWLSDLGDAPQSAQIVNGWTIMLPPEMCMLTPPGMPAKGDIDFRMRISMFGPCLFGCMPAGYEETDPVIKVMKRYLELYKNIIRPVLPTCKMFHHTPIIEIEGDGHSGLAMGGPVTGSVAIEGARRSDYCVLECAAEDRSSSIAGIFKLNDAEKDYIFYPKGLDIGKMYEVTMDNNGQTTQKSGFDLRQNGVRIPALDALRSELLIFKAMV